MNPRFLRRVVMVSWTVATLGTAGLVIGTHLFPGGLPSWLVGVALTMALVGIPVATWSPVALVSARALAAGRVQAVAIAGIVLGWAAVAFTFIAATSTGTIRPAAAWWDAIVRMTGPVFALALAAGNWSWLATASVHPRLRWLTTTSIVAMGAFAALVSGMVIVDSGNRRLFALLGLLLATALVSSILVRVISRYMERLSK